MLFRSEAGLSKPDPAIYHHTLQALGLANHPQAAFFVDDREENVAAARALGIHAFLFQDALTLTASLRALGLPL